MLNLDARIDINEKESQDVAVIELEKTGDETADLQIVGDEDLYGEDYILEASEEDTKKIEGKFGAGFNNSSIVIVDILTSSEKCFIFSI